MAARKHVVGAIVDDIKRRIESGDLSPGDQLPPTRELAERYESAPRSVHHAVALLKASGHVTSAPGKGVYVADTRLKGVDRVDRYLTDLGQVEADTPRRTADAPAWVRELLDLEPGGECILRSRRVRDGDRVVQYGFSWVHPRVAAVVPEVDTTGALMPSYQAVYRDRSGQTVRQETVHTARFSTSEDMAVFGLTDPDAVPIGRNVYSDDAGVIGVGEVAYEPGSELPVHKT
jgi:DNA-binding GntR family transcriptional regulator